MLHFPWQMPGRRIKRYRFSAWGLQVLFTTGMVWGVRQGIPKTARVVGVQLDRDLNCINLYMEHDSFACVEEGFHVPEGPVVFSDVTAETREWKEAY